MKTCGSNFYLYEEIKKSDRVNSAGYTCYVERNQWMIDESDMLIIFYDNSRIIKPLKSGTAAVVEYVKRSKKIYNTFLING